MVRHRVPNRSSGKEGPIRPPKGIHGTKPSSKSPFSLTHAIGTGLVLGVCAYFGYHGYWQTRVNTPLSAPRVVDQSGLDVPSRYWGSYRPGVYFGLKTRSPHDLLAGLMWFLPDQVMSKNDIGFRHWCEQGDNLARYGWIKHDGEIFGLQEILDRNIKLTTSFMKRTGGEHGGDWTARIKVEPLESKKKPDSKPSTVSLFFYVGIDEGGDGNLNPVLNHQDVNHMEEISGRTSNLGSFRVKFVDNGSVKQHFHAQIMSPGPQSYTDLVMKQLRRFDKNIIGLDANPNLPSGNPDLLVYQVNVNAPFEMDIVFESDSNVAGRIEGELSGKLYSQALAALSREYDTRFEGTFRLQQKGFSVEEINFAQAAISNMIGGIGYFHGHSLVQSDLNPQPVKYWVAPLYSAVPSRSFFPRGFLWDEGFHNLLISKWDPRISADIIGHWLDLINVEGWIPREQILGLEARAKVPSEFVVQHNKNANPPTLLLTLHSLVEEPMNQKSAWFKAYLQRLWPRLEVWYNWFSSTQQGPVPGSFRWRGRNETTLSELNPKTLTSGLDDYPRASHPSEDERHLDLRCWMALASKLMTNIGKLIGTDYERYEHTSEFLHENNLLDQMHWSEEHQAYLDFGLHSEDVRLERPPVDPRHRRAGMAKPDMARVTLTEPRLQYVPQLGYNSLFPFILQIIDASSPKLAAILADLENTDKLCTPFGLRSLSASASLYKKRNTEHDPPYWRGPIWININFLAVRALKHYATIPGPNQKRAEAIYTKLRSNLIDNVVKEYYRTGYIWEQYSDQDGHGQGCRPFTGWSALVVLMMGENY